MTWIPGDSITVGGQTVYSYTHNDNGLTLLMCPVADSQVCAYMRVVHAGSKDEDACVPTGAAHFIEHMSFRIQDGKIWKLAAKGDQINAETNMDSTRFFVVHLPEQTASTIEIDASRFKQTSVPADKVPIERHAVLNEMERGQRAENLMFHTTSSVAVLEGGYHHSTIGSDADVKNTWAEDMGRFRRKFYTASNTTLIFCGSFDPNAVRDQVHEHFGSMPHVPKAQAELAKPARQLGMRMVELRTQAPCGMICMAFHQPSGSTKESIALQCIDMLTWHNEQGRAEPLLKQGLLHDVGMYTPRQRNDYLVFFNGTFGKTSPSIRGDVQNAMFKTLQSFGRQQVTTSQLDVVKTALRDRWARNTESVTDLMNELGRSASIGDWRDYDKRHAALDSLTPNDIRATALRVFVRDNLTVTHLIPFERKQAPAPAVGMPLVSRCTQQSPDHFATTPPAASAWSVHNVQPTTNVVHVPRAKYLRAVVSARFSPAQHDIASLFVSNMGNGCALHATPTSTLMSMHSERSFTHDHEYIHLTMAMPDATQTLEEAAHLMFHGEWLKPTFAKDFVKLQKKHIIEELRSKHNDQEYQLKKHFIQRLFTHTTYDEPIETRIQRIRHLTERDMRAFHAKWIRPACGYVTIVSPTMEKAKALANVLTTSPKRPAAAQLSWKARPRTASTTHKVLRGYGSFNVAIGQTVRVPHHSDDAVALQCAIHVLGGGMTGRLMHTVREQKGLGTYGLYAMLQTVSAQTDHILCIQGTFSPVSVREGLACTRQLIREWHAHGITADEFSDAQQCLVGQQLIGSEEIDALHTTILKAILDERDPEASYHAYTQKVRALTLDQVNAALQKYIDPDALTETVIGPTQL